MTGCCEHGNEPLNAKSAGNFWTEVETLTHSDSAHLGSHFLISTLSVSFHQFAVPLVTDYQNSKN